MIRILAALLCSVALQAQSASTCKPSRLPDASSESGWNGWGNSQSNDRFQNSAALPAENIQNLKLKWAFGFPGVRSVMGQPSVVGGRVFIGVDTGEVYSLDAATGCVFWSTKVEASVRTAITVSLGNRPVAFFGDLRANVYAVDGNTGEIVWEVKVDDHPSARITGAPQLFDGRLYVPVASGEEGTGRSPKYECCTFRGSVIALDAATGKSIWKSYVIPEEPKPTRKTKAGVQMFAPSGAGIWSAPTIDPKRRALYVGTGDAYSEPASSTSDAIVAMSLDTGKILWSVQDTENDVWLAGCGGANQPEHCPETLGPDHDFGSPPMLKRLSSGRELLIAGQKSGNVWAHDPDKLGAVVWRTALVNNTKEFGGKIIWGGAADNNSAYFGLGPGGIGAVQLTTGERTWFASVKPNVAAQPGMDGPLTAIPGAIFSGGWDGVLRAFDAKSGKLLWEYNTVRDFEALNGVAAKGGSIGAAGPVVAGGRLFVPSGYVGVKNGMPGNVLLMFSAE
jgi:polyvinyl alcohol dehydrogenase (cytochrome)